MKSGSVKIAVLLHEGERYPPKTRYIVHHLANFWRDDGHEVEFLFGVGRYVPADIILVHVNLSVVPPEYLEFASRYPVSLNAGIRDIRKSAISANLLRADDEWEGPVIVKSDLNYAGLPEQGLQRSWIERRWSFAHKLRLKADRRRGKVAPYQSADHYEIYAHLRKVPASRVANRQLVIEKFLPERDNGLYCTRVYQFLGDRWSCTRMLSRLPIVKANESISAESVDPHEEVVEWRKRLKMDYGKLDYVVHHGEPVLLDANKTIGASRYEAAKESMGEETIRANRRALAEGIYAYL